MTHSHKERWSYTTLVDHENNMVVTLNLFDNKSYSVVIDKIINGKVENKVIEISPKPNINDLITKHQEMVIK
tara:strand:- start:344 stop:559 length:216 start_codon:yes stop_codon:yes gene_type:complete